MTQFQLATVQAVVLQARLGTEFSGGGVSQLSDAACRGSDVSWLVRSVCTCGLPPGVSWRVRLMFLGVFAELLLFFITRKPRVE